MQQLSQDPNSDHPPNLPMIKIHHPSSPRHPHTSATPVSSALRKIGVAVDLSDESAYAVRWAVDNYLRPEGDAVVLLHVSPTNVLYGADWGPIPHSPNPNPNPSPNPISIPNSPANPQPSQDDFDAFTIAKATELAKPIKEAGIPYKIHIVKDHDMKERLCLEVERLGLSTVIMGSRGFGAARRGSDGRLGSVSDYCVHHCVCPVVVVRCTDDKESAGGHLPVVVINERKEEEEEGKEEEHEKVA